MILEENSDVVFDTIQYSYQEKKAIFYTDKPISTEKWEKYNENAMEYLADDSYIESHIKELLSSDRILNSDCVSIYDVLNLSKKNCEDEKAVNDKIREIREGINCKLQSISDHCYVTILRMGYKTYECNISVEKYYRHSDEKREKFSFGKFGYLYIKEREGDYIIGDKILEIIGSEISEIYDYQLEMSSKRGPDMRKKSVNSIFLVVMGDDGVDIYNGNVSNSTFGIKMYSFSNEIEYKCSSSNLMQLLSGNEYELYKKIFVKISDCPIWMQEELQELRKKQLIEESKKKRSRKNKYIII